jgi:hypothetical protein
MDAMQLYRVAANKGPEVKVCLTLTFWQTDFA